MTATPVQPNYSPKNLALMPVATYNATASFLLNFDAIDCDGLVVIADVTALGGTGTPTVTFAITGWDPVSGTSYVLGTGSGLSAAVTGAAQKVFRIHPNIPNGTLTAQDLVPTQVLVSATLTGTTPTWTGSLAIDIDL